MTVTRLTRQPCRLESVLRVCLPPELIPGQLRMPASPGMNQRLASDWPSLMPKMASTKSTGTHAVECGTSLELGEQVCLQPMSPSGEPGIVIHSKEGITEGNCLAMSLYGIALMPLALKMREAVPKALQLWY